MKQERDTLSKTNRILLISLFCVIFIVSILNCLEGSMEYIYAPIACLSVIGIVILIKK